MPVGDEILQSVLSLMADILRLDNTTAAGLERCLGRDHVDRGEHADVDLFLIIVHLLLGEGNAVGLYRNVSLRLNARFQYACWT